MNGIVEKVATEFDSTKKLASELVGFVLNQLADELNTNGKLRINGFGTFTIKEKPARKARNPKTGETIDVEAKNVVKFTPAKNLKELIQ